MSTAWIYLLIAAVLEIAWVIGMRYSEGFTKLVPTVIMLVIMFANIWFLAQALRVIPIGTGYAIWTGIGAVGVAIIGIILFNESASVARIACIGLVVCGIIGLKLTTPA